MAAALLTNASEASAECNSPTGHLLANHTVLPPDPRLVFFAPYYGEFSLGLLADGESIPHELTPIEFTPIEGGERIPRAYWLSAQTGNARTLTVRYKDYRDERELVFPLDPAWSHGGGEVLSSVRHPAEGGFSCPPPDNLYRVAVSSRAVAYRVEWAGAKPGKSIVPTQHMLRWPWRKLSGPNSMHSIDLGYESCAGHSIPRELLDADATVQLTALYPDGSEEPLAPLHLDRGPGKYSLDRILAATALELLDESRASRVNTRDAQMSDDIVVHARILSFFGTLGLMGLLGMIMRKRPRLSILVGLGLLGTGIGLLSAKVAATHFVPAAGGLVVWLLLQWARRIRALSR